MTASAQNEGRRLVLVVDDEQMIRELLTRTLEREGFAVEVVNDGPAALDRMAGPPRPDVVVLDQMMPDVDGFEVLSALKADSGTASIPVVMLTGKADPRFADAAVEAGALCVLYKPWKYDELIAAIRGAIS